MVAAASRGTFARWPEFLVLWFVLEFLLYYARYQWNDARGVDNDRVHPARHLRSRLPVGTTDRERRLNVRVSLAAAAVRVIVAALVGLTLGVIVPVSILIATVFSCAAIYETLRGLSRPGLRRMPGPYEVGVWLAVGLGYPIRVGLGLALTDIPQGSATIWIGLVYAFTFGTMYVLLCWALESSDFCVWNGQVLTVSEEVGRKPHIGALTPFLGGQREAIAIHPVSGPVSRSSAGHLGSTSSLGPCSTLYCPWNLALTSAALLAGFLGAALAELPYWPAGFGASVVCLVGATGLRVYKTSLPRWTVTVAVAIILTLLASGDAPAAAWVVAVPWLALATCYSWLRASSYLGSMGGGDLIVSR